MNRRLPIHQRKHIRHSFEEIDPCYKVYVVNAGKPDPLQQTRNVHWTLSHAEVTQVPSSDYQSLKLTAGTG